LPFRSNKAAPLLTIETESAILVHGKKTKTIRKSMKIQKIIGENGAMPQLCGKGMCPSAIIVENGDIFVQGYVPAPGESTDLSAPSGESFVRMPRATFEKIARQVLAS
jgi:hypothetical protein